MSGTLIAVGILLLVFPAYLALMGIMWLFIYALASNWFDYLVYPGAVALTVAGLWCVLHGAGVIA